MSQEVQLPQLGESVAEGIITQWLVEVGDTVEVDQPLVEISTDKVDTEIPSPVAGTVQELRGEVDDTIEVGEVIVVIGDGAGGGGGGGAPAEAPAQEPEQEPAQPAAAAAPADAGDGAPSDAGGTASPKVRKMLRDAGVALSSVTGTGPAGRVTQDDAAAAIGGGTTGTATSGEGVLTSPLVRKLLREAGIDAADVTGTGPGGRITRADAEAAIEAGPQEAAAPAAEAAAPAAATQQAGAVTPPPAVVGAAGGVPDRPGPGTKQVEFGGERQVVEPISRVRKAIAGGMKNSLDTTAQLTAIVEIDMTAVMNLRAAVKDQFKAREGVSLSPLPFIMRAVAMTLGRHPVMNSTLDLESGEATYKRFINLGMAVDTERGLLVPNIKNAQDLTLPGIARAIGDLAKRTRGKGLKPDDISGGTFTVTNTGSLGTLLDTPILNPPEVGILGAAAIEKRPVVVSDAYGDSIAIRHMTYMCLSYDHQALDGADAARFLQDLKWTLEHHDFRGELGL